ncbi:MAG: ATP-binding protein [Parcubacteria group bacterium]
MNTQENLKQLITEWMEFELPGDIILRQFDKRLLSGKKILAIIGPRRGGKTYYCFQIIKEFLADVPKENILYINFEDERLYPLVGDELTLLLNSYLELATPKKNKKIYFFLDEVQNIEFWSKWARRMSEKNPDIKLILTGSSSKLLSKEIATELRGRSLSFMVYPFSFKEFLKFKNVNFNFKTILYGKQRARIKKIFNEFLEQGGFPEVLSEPMQKKVLQEYYNTIFYNDIVERYDVKNVALLEDFLKMEINNFSSMASISKMEKVLASMGRSASKATLSKYLSYAKSVFLLFELSVYDYKIKEQMRHLKKIYAVDTGLLNAIRFSFSDDYGRLLENLVFLEFLKVGKNVFYFRGIGECDFLLKENRKIVAAFQVTKNLKNYDTRQREIKGLLEAMEKYDLDEGVILTEDEYEEFEKSGRKIKVLPVWYWASELK